MTDTVSAVIASLALIAVTFLSIVPILPTPIMAWVIAFAFAWATDFQVVSLLSIGIITVIALAATLNDFWLPLIGIKTEGGSCGAAVGTMIGGIVGTMIIPIPIIGTLIGSVVGAVLFDAIGRRNLQQSSGAAVYATKNFVYGIVVRIIGTALITAVFFGALLIG